MTSSPSGSARRSAYKAEPTRLSQAGVDGEIFALAQTSHNAAPQHFIEQPLEQITVTKKSVASLQKVG